MKEKLKIKWISDFRDPWTDIDYFHQLPLTKKTKAAHFRLEKEVLEKSDAVLVVGETMKENYLKFNNNIHVITNGFDTDLTDHSKVTLDRRFYVDAYWYDEFRQESEVPLESFSGNLC